MGLIWIMRQICVILVCHEYGHVWVEELLPLSPRGEDLKKLANQKQELPVEGHVW
jgi:hypothetical protein